MSSQFLNAQEYSNVMLLLLKNQLVMGKLVDGQFKNEVTDENGLLISVKRPPRFLDKKDGTAALAAQDIVTGSASVSVTEYSKVHIEVGDIEYIQSYNALMQNATMKSAASTLAHSIDRYIGGLMLGFNSWEAGGQAGGSGGTNAGVGGVPIHNTSEAMSAHTRLMQQGVPDDGNISAVVNFTDAELIRGGLSGTYMDNLNQTALQRVKIPIVSTIDWYASQNLPLLTMGTRTQGDGSSAGAQIAGSNQNKNYRDVKTTMTQTLAIDGLTGAMTIKKGEVFTIQNVYAWDWRANQALPYLQQFTVTADAVSAAGAVTVTISPAIIVQGTNDGTNTDANTAFATVDSLPVDNAYIKFVGAISSQKPMRAAFHKRAISLVSARLHMPFSGTASYAIDPETGIAVRYWRGSDIGTGKHIHRWDCMYGGAVMDPNLGTRIDGYGA